MLEIVKDVLSGQPLNAQILADYLEDHCSGHPEFARYHKLLLMPQSLRMQTLLDTVIKFGPKKQRSLASKIIRQAMRSQDRYNAKGTLRAYMKKKWSLKQPWYMADKIGHALGVPASTPSSEDG